MSLNYLHDTMMLYFKNSICLEQHGKQRTLGAVSGGEGSFIDALCILNQQVGSIQ